jgi:hypothetical protein
MLRLSRYLVMIADISAKLNLFPDFQVDSTANSLKSVDRGIENATVQPNPRPSGRAVHGG